ncbi:MAG: CBS domain-containing protein [bacterium]|nr:CBS domain-containing protein [bacterium]
MSIKALKDILTKEVISVFPETSLFEAAKILYKNQFTGLPVVDLDRVLVGIVTEYDLINMESEIPTHIPTLQKIFQTIPAEEGREKEIEGLYLLKVKDVMNPDPLVLSQDATVEETINTFREHHRVNPIPIIDSQRRIVGIVSRSDLVKFFTEFPPTLDKSKTFAEQAISRKTGALVSKSVALLEESYQLVSKISEIGRGEVGEHFLLFNKLVPAITRAINIDQALKEVVKIICESTNWILGEIWRPHENRLFLRLKFSWPEGNHNLDKFITFSKGFLFAPGEGLPGRVWLSKKPEWEDDLTKTSLSTFLKAKFAEESNIGASFGFPILDAQDNVIAVIIFFMQKASRKDEGFVRFISAVSNGLNLFLRYKLLEERIALLQSAVGSSNQGILITDPDARILFANKAWENLTGYSVDEILNKKPSELWGGHMPKEFYEKLWHTIKIEKKPFVGEVRNVKKDGTKFWQADYITPILDEYGEIKFFLSIEPDISDKKVKEQFKDEFVSIIGHQLRNPLISISWLIEWMAKSSSLTVDDKNKLQEIYTQNKNLHSFIEDLLMLSRAGKSDLSREQLDLKSEIDAITKEVQEHNPGTKVSFGTKGGNFSILANRSMAVQVFANLAYNTAEYADKKDGKADIKLERTDSEFLFSTHNNGPEISEEDKPKIFSKLFRSDVAKEHKKSGTGLGLFIVKTICDNLGWKIWFESGLGKGTTFYVNIPLESL